MSSKKQDLPYVSGEFEFEGVRYKSTELPFERDFAPLIFNNIPFLKNSAAYFARSVAIKTNLKMSRGIVKPSPTFPIKNQDLVWFAVVKAIGSHKTEFEEIPMKQEFGPYLVREENNQITVYTPKGTPQRMLSDLVLNPENKDIGSVDVRLFRHVDRENAVGLTYAFEKDDDGLYQIVSTEDMALESIEPVIEKSNSDHSYEVDLEEHIQETLQEESLKDITQRHIRRRNKK